MTAWARQSVKEFYAQAKPNKYRAVPTIVDGHKFPSKHEATRYGQLKLLEKLGEITSLELQPRYKLCVDGIFLTTYIADFRYVDSVGKSHTEDAKGMRKGTAYDLFRLKAKLMLVCHKLLVEEV